MAVKFPGFVQIGAHKYGILYPYHFKERSDHCAQCDHSMHEIRINDLDVGGNIRPESEIVENYFHEILHAADTIYLQHKVGNMKDAEDIINGLAEGLTQAFMAGQFPVMEDD